MTVAMPKEILDCFYKCKKYIKSGCTIDENAPEEAKVAFNKWVEWNKTYDDFM